MKDIQRVDHIHYWRIQDDDKTGICKCGAVQRFIGRRQFEMQILGKGIRMVSPKLLEELIGVK